MKLKAIAPILLGLTSLPLFAAECPTYNAEMQYINGDQINDGGSFYQAKNNPTKGTGVASSWNWESIPACTTGLVTERHFRPHAFEQSVRAYQVELGDLTQFTQIDQAGVDVVIQAEGGAQRTFVDPGSVLITENHTFGSEQSLLDAGTIRLESQFRGVQEVTSVAAEGINTPSLIVNGQDVSALIQALEARIAQLESTQP